MNNTYRGHPLMIFSFLKPFLFVLVIPVIKGLLQYIIYRRISGIISFEIYLFAAILLIAVARWLSFTVVHTDKSLTINSGMIFKSHAKISLDKLSCFSQTVNPVLKLCGAVSFEVNTEAGGRENADFKFILKSDDAVKLSSFVYGDAGSPVIKYSNPKIALFSVSSSSALTGIIVAAPFINRAGKLLNIAITEMIFDEIDTFSNKFMEYFPPAVTALTVIVVLAFGISFIISFLKNLTFRLRVDENRMETSSGLLSRKRTVFSKTAVNNTVIIQTPIMRFFKNYSIYASVGGFGTRRSEKAVIIPCGKHREIKSEFRTFFPFLQRDSKPLKANQSSRSLKRFLWLPKLYGLLILAVCITLMIIFRHFDRFVLFIASMALLVDLYYADLCKCCYLHGGLSIGDNIGAKGAKGFNFCEMNCDKTKVGVIRIKETLPDRKYGTCKVKVTVRSENAYGITVKNLNKSEVLKALNEAYGISKANSYIPE